MTSKFLFFAHCSHDKRDSIILVALFQYGVPESLQFFSEPCSMRQTRRFQQQITDHHSLIVVNTVLIADYHFTGMSWLPTYICDLVYEWLLGFNCHITIYITMYLLHTGTTIPCFDPFSISWSNQESFHHLAFEHTQKSSTRHRTTSSQDSR